MRKKSPIFAVANDQITESDPENFSDDILDSTIIAFNLCLFFFINLNQHIYRANAYKTMVNTELNAELNIL